MNIGKYIGMDVHKAMTVIAVLNSDGKLPAEAITETKSQTIVDFITGQRGTLQRKETEHIARGVKWLGR